MTSIALSGSQRDLLSGLAMGRVLDHVPAPVLLLRNDGTAWLNASARELDDWLRNGDPTRSLMQELGPALRPADSAANLCLAVHSSMPQTPSVPSLPSHIAPRFSSCCLVSLTGK